MNHPRTLTESLPAGDPGGRTRRLVIVRILPFLFLLYISNYVDRTSIAYAALGMTADLGLSDRVLGLAAGLFFIGYVALQVPGAVLVERWSARRAIGAVMVAWGCCTALTGMVHTAGQLYWARLLLGAAEAAFFPGVIVYLSHWFTRADRARATGYFMAAIPVSQALASPLAGWIVGHSFGGVAGWRWLFILEGLPAVLLGVIAYCFLPDLPREAHWLSPTQREWLEKELLAETEPVDVTPLRSAVGLALRSRVILLLAVAAFFNYCVSYGFYFWFPTMLKREFGLTDTLVGLLGTIPYIAVFLAVLVNGWHSDRHMERRWHSAIPCLAAVIGALCLMTHHLSLPVAILFFTMIALSAAFYPAFWAMPTTLLRGSAAAVAVGFINGIASLAGFAAPYLLGYLSTRTESFNAGMAATAATGVIAFLLLLSVPKASLTACSDSRCT